MWSIRGEIEQFSWEKALRNLNINEMAFLFNRTIKLRIFFQIIFLTKQSFVMTKIHLGSIATSNSLFKRKTVHIDVTF